MIITMSGKAGSGKGTVCKLLSEKLGYEHISIGNIKRAIAKEMGMTISQFNEEGDKPENAKEFDLKYEEYQKNLDVNSNIILEGRLSWRCQPKAFKVYLDVSDEEAARRIFNDTERLGDTYSSEQEVLEITRTRNTKDAQRYINQYGVDINDKNNYDLVIDTTTKIPQQVADEIIEVFNEKIKTNSK